MLLSLFGSTVSDDTSIVLVTVPETMPVVETLMTVLTLFPWVILPRLQVTILSVSAQ